MAIEFGVIAAKMPLAEFVSALRESGASMTALRPLPSLDGVPADGSREYLAAGERNGISYLVDWPMLLSVGNSDLLAAVALARRTLVAACGSEEPSGSFWFHASEGAELRRIYWMSRAEIGEPFSAGDPLASEAGHPFEEDFDGTGIFAAMRELGFDFEGWRSNGPFELFVLDGVEEPLRKPLEDMIDDHCRRYQIVPGHAARAGH